jgi:hypothetical protein
VSQQTAVTKGSIARLSHTPPDSAGSQEACAAVRDLEDPQRWCISGRDLATHLRCTQGHAAPCKFARRLGRSNTTAWEASGPVAASWSTSASGMCSEPGQREELHGEEPADSALVFTMGCQARQDVPIPEPLPNQ